MARIKITERRLSVEDTLSRRATREVTQGLNLAHHFSNSAVVRTVSGVEARMAAPRHRDRFNVRLARFHEQSVYIRARLKV